MKRINTILMITLLGQLLLFGLIVTTCGQQSNRIEPVSLLDGIQRADVTRITIEAKNGKNTDKTVLEKKNDDWVLPEKFGYKADKSKVDKLLGTLLGLQSSRIVSKGPEHREDLKVTDESFQRRVVLEAGGKKKTMWVGSSTTGSSTTCVRVDSREETFATSDLKIWDLNARASGWLAQPYLQIQSPRLADISIDGPKSKIELSRTALDNWTIQGKKADTATVDKMLDKLDRVNITDVEGQAKDASLAKRLASAEKHWTVSLALADKDLPATTPKATKQDEADKDSNASETATDKQGDQAATPTPNISERIVLEIYSRPGHKYDLLLNKKGDPYVVVVSKYTLDKLTDADTGKLLGEKPQEKKEK